MADFSAYQGTRAVAEAHRFDAAALERYLREQADVRLRLEGRDRPGRALARERDGQVTVEVRLVGEDEAGTASSSSAAARLLS